MGALIVLLCLWDYDTFKEESLGQADVAAVITGDLSKHSQAFYTAKIEYTKAIIDKGGTSPKLPTLPTLKDRYDDLAVAEAKVGKLDDAIATLAAKEKLFPGEYTTEANLGTFYAMKGDNAKALEHLKAAIKINPDAHFGREKFQVQLLEYLDKLAKDPDLAKQNFLGIDVGKTFAGESDAIMAMAFKKAKKRKDKVPTPEVAAIVGLMRFGDGEGSTHLWWALGWALVQQGDAQLAQRAFRRAEVLGHKRAGEDGTVLSTVPKVNEKAGPCCPKPDVPKLVEQWTRLSKTYDAEWKKGQAKDAQRQKSEDAKIAKKQLKAVFGY